MPVDAVIFDLDGVLIDSEPVWADVRRAVTLAHNGQWEPGSQEAMMGMSSLEWSQYMHDTLAVQLEPRQIVDLVVAEMIDRYHHDLPLRPGAVDAVRRLAARWPLGLASSANRPLINTALSTAGIAELFRVTRSTEEVGRGKPAPDIYLDVADEL